MVVADTLTDTVQRCFHTVSLYLPGSSFTERQIIFNTSEMILRFRVTHNLYYTALIYSFRFICFSCVIVYLQDPKFPSTNRSLF